MRFTPIITLLALIILPNFVLAQANDPLLLAGGLAEEQSTISDELLFWSKVFILLLIVVLGFLSYRNFRAEER